MQSFRVWIAVTLSDPHTEWTCRTNLEFLHPYLSFVSEMWFEIHDIWSIAKTSCVISPRDHRKIFKIFKNFKKIFEKERPRNRIQAKGQHCIIRQVFFLNLNMNLSLINLSLNLSPDELFNVGENLNRQVSTLYCKLWTEPNC